MMDKAHKCVTCPPELVHMVRTAAQHPTLQGYYQTVDDVADYFDLSKSDAGTIVRALGYSVEPKLDEIERMSRKIALLHAQKIVCTNREGTQTVASLRGFGHWGDSADRYADRRWNEYTSAAEAVLKEQPGLAEFIASQTAEQKESVG